MSLKIKDKLLDDNLDLSCSDLKEVPVRVIAPLKRAKNVDLSNNVLSSLPKNFVILTQIVKLDLSRNMLTELPENFGEMIQLRHLDLFKNEISRLPLSLGNLKNLRWLDLKENPLSPAVAKVAGPCTTQQDCVTCAKSVVTYLANAKLTIEEEQKRITAAANENGKTSEKSQPSKKEPKKKKKKDDKKQVEKEKHQKAPLPEKIDSAKPKTKSRKGKGGKRSAVGTCFRYFLQLWFWLFFLLSLAFCALVILRSYNEHTAKPIYDYIENQTGLPVHVYHEVGSAKARVLFDDAQVFVGRAIEQTREFANNVYRRYISSEAANNEKEL